MPSDAEASCPVVVLLCWVMPICATAVLPYSMR